MSLIGDSATEFHLDERVRDTASERLVAELALNDIAAVQAARKGKARETDVRSDEEIALDVQATSLSAYIGALNDHRLALSIDRALASDARHIRRIVLQDQAELDDHRAAAALRDGHDMPRQTLEQRMMEQSLASSQPVSGPSSARRGRTSNATETEREAINVGIENVHITTPATFKPTVSESPKSHETGPECVICRDAVVVRHSFQATCAHCYCRDCLVNLVETSLRDETLHPLRCCKTPLPLESGVFKFISLTLRFQFLAKCREFSVPAGSRCYCSNPRCSAFLGASGDTKRNLTCGRCSTISCSHCKNKAHLGKDCSGYSELQSTLQLRETAAANNWQTCPECHAIVELSHGCYHISCRCSAQFCYLCAARWKTCNCRLWDERQLLNDAERRVRNQFGGWMARMQPVAHAERVHQRMEELRGNHECETHVWRYRRGSGRCEQCGDTLPMYLMRCIHCQALVCRRCSVNRL